MAGLLLTQDERFIAFEIDTDEAHHIVKSVQMWTDVTHEQNCSEHNRGIGAGHGALAIRVLRELNACSGRGDPSDDSATLRHPDSLGIA
ncbi:hypothetical protein OOT46_24345 [Aquabacterium sp. A7-Y]|uniref:hypothetical protein n=1 Tax=Aquabacterium sp. A7-Y TaxID=1349605 RepID=UPI00223DD2C0|nr:hypothetical protein [Aquabacterium sp. A7-Y]MCW7540956.1 hypothetical protein [Aquabacterium sp. A7-Y]